MDVRVDVPQLEHCDVLQPLYVVIFEFVRDEKFPDFFAVEQRHGALVDLYEVLCLVAEGPCRSYVALELDLVGFWGGGGQAEIVEFSLYAVNQVDWDEEIGE